MAYITLSHFLPNDRQKKRKKLQLQTYQDPRVPTASMSTFRGVPNQSYLGWMLHTPKQFDDDVAQKEEIEMMPIEKAATRCKNIDELPSNLRNYENTFGLPRFFELENFQDEVPFTVCYTYAILDLLLVLEAEDQKAGFCVVTTAEGCEVNYINSSKQHQIFLA